MTHELVSQVPLFAALPAAELEQLAATLRRRRVPAGTLVLQEGQVDDHFYILLEGQVEILKALGTDAERLLGLRRGGSFIGEMSLFSRGGRHTASVRARETLTLLEMSAADFSALLLRQPRLAYEFVRLLSQRLDESENLTVRDLLEKNRELRQAYDALQAAQAQIIEKGRLEAELAVARTIQRSLLPVAPPRVPGFEIGVRLEPMASVGGDFYTFVPLEGDRLGIAIGDVTNHGVPAAIFMALTYSLVRAEAGRLLDPAAAVRSVNSLLLPMNEASMFATVLHGVLDPVTREFHYVRAGHEVPVLLDAAGAAIPLERGAGQALGIFPELMLDEQRVTLPPGGLLLLYTDGVTDALNDSGEAFGLERLLAVLATHPRAGAQAVCEQIWLGLQAHSGARVQQDDITLLAVRAA